MHSDRPAPVVDVADLTKLDALFVPKSDLFVGASDDHVFTSRVESDSAGIETKFLVRANRLDVFTACNRVER